MFHYISFCVGYTKKTGPNESKGSKSELCMDSLLYTLFTTYLHKCLVQISTADQPSPQHVCEDSIVHTNSAHGENNCEIIVRVICLAFFEFH